MRTEWPLVTIDDIKAPESGSIAIGPFGSRMKSDCYVEEGIPVIRGTNITGGPTFEGDFVYITEEKADTLGSSNVYQYDLVFPHRGAIGEVGIILEKKRYILSSSLMKLTCDTKKANPKFLYYFFKSHIGRHELLKNASQVGTPGIGQPLTSLKGIELRLPPLKIQGFIEKTLSSLDNKIELNRQTNQTLEQIAQAIFKSWFVDFDPVRAKIAAREAFIQQHPEVTEAAIRAAAGTEGDTLAHVGAKACELAAMCAISGKTEKQLSELGADNLQQLKTNAALFPNFLMDTEFGEIPDGWTPTKLKTLTKKIGSGATPKGGSKVYISEGVYFIRSQNVYDAEFKWDGLVCIDNDAATKLKSVSVNRDDVLINITGASILRTCVVDPEFLPARVNQHVAIVRARDAISPNYIHLQLLRESTKDYLLGMNAGGSREAVTKGHLESVPTLYPGELLMESFHNLIQPLFRKIELGVSESRILTDLRDTLLPKLLYGEIQVGVDRGVAQ